MATTAERFSKRMGDNGSRFTARDGTSLATVAASFGARRPERHDGMTRYHFPDGSSIIVAESGWDIALSPDCWCWLGAGHSEACLAEKAEG